MHTTVSFTVMGDVVCPIRHFGYIYPRAPALTRHLPMAAPSPMACPASGAASQLRVELTEVIKDGAEKHDACMRVSYPDSRQSQIAMLFMVVAGFLLKRTAGGRLTATLTGGDGRFMLAYKDAGVLHLFTPASGGTKLRTLQELCAHVAATFESVFAGAVYIHLLVCPLPLEPEPTMETVVGMIEAYDAMLYGPAQVEFDDGASQVSLNDAGSQLQIDASSYHSNNNGSSSVSSTASSQPQRGALSNNANAALRGIGAVNARMKNAADESLTAAQIVQRAKREVGMAGGARKPKPKPKPKAKARAGRGKKRSGAAA